MYVYSILFHESSIVYPKTIIITSKSKQMFLKAFKTGLLENKTTVLTGNKFPKKLSLSEHEKKNLSTTRKLIGE